MKKVIFSISVLVLLFQSVMVEAGVVQNSKGKCGYVNDAGELIIDYKYDFIGDFNQYGIAQVKNGNKYGMVNQQGELTVPVKYDEIGFFKDGVATLVSGKKYGLVSEDGRVLTEPQFVEILSPNSQGVRLALKKQNASPILSIYSIINKDGRILCSAAKGMIWYYDDFSSFGFPIMSLKNTVDTINTMSGYFGIQNGISISIYGLDGTIALNDSHRNEILQEVFGKKASVKNAEKGSLVEMMPCEDIVSFIYNQKENKRRVNVVYGYYNLKEHKLLHYYTSIWQKIPSTNPYDYTNIGVLSSLFTPTENIFLNSFSDGFGVVWANQTGNERTEIINRNGEIVATFPANSCMPYRNGYMVAKNEQGNYGLLDIKQNVVIPYNYKSTHNYVTGEKNALFMVLQDMNSNWGAVSVNNQQVVPFEYQDIHSFIDHSVVFVQKNNKWGAYNHNRQTLECKYDSLNTYIDDAFLCYNNKNVNVYSVVAQKLSQQVNGCDGVFIADDELHNSTFFRCYNIVNNDTVYGYIDGFADEVLPFVFNEKSKANNAYLIYKDLPTVTFNALEKYRLVLYFSRRERTYQLNGIVPKNDWDY